MQILARKEERILGICRGHAAGTYIHGIFDSREISGAILEKLAAAKGIAWRTWEKEWILKHTRRTSTACWRRDFGPPWIWRRCTASSGRGCRVHTEEGDRITMTEKLEQVLPENIEKRSFEIISQELGERSFDPLEEPVIKRCIHTSADFDYADTLVFSPGAVRRALEAVRSGALIVTDTNMGKAGVNKKVLASFGGEAVCFMADPDVAKAAKEEGTTRAVASMKKAAALAEETDRPLILAVGNAPTAWWRSAPCWIRERSIRPW